MRVQKATSVQLKRYNRQLLLRAVYGGLADNRAALAQLTGLTKPTVSSLVGELIDEGLLSEGGRGPSKEMGGKRPRLLAFMPGARQVVGLALDEMHAVGVLADLAGTTSAQHQVTLDGPEDALPALCAVASGLIAQLDAPLLCLGVGVPGTVNTASGTVRRSERFGWRSFPLAKELADRFGVPVHAANSTELCALAQFAFGLAGKSSRSLVTLLVDGGVEVGVTLEGGRYHYGGDIGHLRLACESNRHLADLLSWASLERRARVLRQRYPDTRLPVENLSYLHLRYHLALGDPAARALHGELSEHLAEVMAWVMALLHPDHIALAGPLVDLGEGFLEQVVTELKGRHAPEELGPVSFTLASSDNLSARGAVALGLQRQLAIL